MEEKRFRASLFGGFNRKDVVEYIEKNAAAANERIAALEKDVDELVKENHALRDSLSDAEGTRDQLSVTLRESYAEQDSLRAERDAAVTERDALRAEAERLRPQAEEYAAIKSSLAELELAAHRRADAYEAETREKLDALLRDCRAQCERLLAAADTTCANVASELQQGAENVSRLPDALRALRAGLDDMKKS
ncbi:MAG: hypothetical protein IJT71_01355 [Oscillospiraceae bacterium]|nr:hypothetical protein [Oscillospiraceae bacterium]